MAGTLTIAGLSAGLASGQKLIGPVTMTGVNPVGAIFDATLDAGDNPFVLPSGETVSAVAVFLGTTSAAVTFRTNLDAADGGVKIAPYVGAGVPFCVIPLPAGVTTVILNASATVAGVEISLI